MIHFEFRLVLARSHVSTHRVNSSTNNDDDLAVLSHMPSLPSFPTLPASTSLGSLLSPTNLDPPCQNFDHFSAAAQSFQSVDVNHDHTAPFKRKRYLIEQTEPEGDESGSSTQAFPSRRDESTKLSPLDKKARNKEAAARYRQRKKEAQSTTVQRCQQLEQELAIVRNQLSMMMQENINLRNEIVRIQTPATSFKQSEMRIVTGSAASFFGLPMVNSVMLLCCFAMLAILVMSSGQDRPMSIGRRPLFEQPVDEEQVSSLVQRLLDLLSVVQR